jgi:hypothetical protein
VSSRQEQKEARRKERLEREAAEARAAARRKRFRLASTLLAGAFVVAAAIAAIALGIGGEDEQEAASGTTPTAGVALPEQRTTDPQKAAEAAGCTLVSAEYEGAEHAEKEFTPADYKTNPPTSGTHFPDWYDDGVYAPGTTPNLGMLVHTLEHGRINVQYAEGTPAADVEKLEALYAEQNDGYHILLYENATDMEHAVAATAWTQKLGCDELNDRVFDALRTFRARYIDKGPEQVP